jgi:metal-responsive CopG/Arc/MetJ family transcriptional regulator
MATEPKDQRVPVMMSVSELKALDDWAFEQRIRSRGEAIRQLIELGLKTAKTQKPQGAKRTQVHQHKASDEASELDTPPALGENGDVIGEP